VPSQRLNVCHHLRHRTSAAARQPEHPSASRRVCFTAALNSHDLDAVTALITDDIVFESTSPPPDGTRYEGRDAVCQVLGQMLAATPQARFSVEEQFSDGSGRAVVRWRYGWADGHVRGVDVVRIRNGQLAESLAYVKG
jgi:ketosteroid isomerase-like protein